MADLGFNFRATSTYVTDGANETYVIHTDTYPTTRGGSTFGWLDTADSRDRNNGHDRRLAGINFGNNVRVQIDLPSSGTWTVHLSMGDGSGPQTATKITVKDNTTTLLTIGPHDTLTNDFYDASDTIRNNTTWPGSEVGASLSFSSTTAIVKLETSGSNTVITHVRFFQTAAPSDDMPAWAVCSIPPRARFGSPSVMY